MISIKDYYLKIPNQLFIPIKEKDDEDNVKIIEESYYNQIKDDKFILIMVYLLYNENKHGSSKINMFEMIGDIGYKLDSHKGKINDNIKNILYRMEEVKLINKLKENKYNITYEMSIIKKDNRLADVEYKTLSRDELEILRSSELEYNILLKLYLYLKIRMWKRPSSEKLEVHGGRAESCYPSYDAITNDIGLATKTIKKYLTELVNLNLIRYDNCGSYYKVDNLKMAIESPNHYVLYDKEDNWKSELKESLKLQRKNILSKGFIFTKNKNNKSLNRSINGKKGYLKKQLNQGKLTEIEYKEEILKLTNKNKGEG